MPWAKVDDTLAFHPKSAIAGKAAMGLWVLALSWSAQQLTDGYVPRSIIKSLNCTDKDAQRLVDAGLWHALPDGGYVFHEWEQRQPSRDEVEAKRDADKERQRQWRDRHRKPDGTFSRGAVTL